MHSVPSSIQGTASMNSPASLDNSLSDMYCSTPRPLPWDADSRYFRLQRDGLVSRRENGSSHSQEESEPLRGEDDAGSESLSKGDKWHACEQGSTEQYCKSSQLSSTKALDGTGHIYSPIEEEDVCPTCLEGKLSLMIMFKPLIFAVKYFDQKPLPICYGAAMMANLHFLACISTSLDCYPLNLYLPCEPGRLFSQLSGLLAHFRKFSHLKIIKNEFFFLIYSKGKRKMDACCHKSCQDYCGLCSLAFGSL